MSLFSILRSPKRLDRRTRGSSARCSLLLARINIDPTACEKTTL